MTDAAPHLYLDFDSEDAAVAAALSNDSALEVLLLRLRDDDPYRESNRTLLKTMRAMHAAGQGVDQATVCSQLNGSGPELKDHVRQLASLAIVCANAPQYCRAVSEAVDKRRMQVALERAMQALESDGAAVGQLLSDALAQVRESASGQVLAFRTGAEMAAETAEAPDFIWQPFLALGAIVELTAKIKVGKTRFLLDLSAAILEGSPFLGFTTQRAAVLYLTEERAPTFRCAMERVGLTGRGDFHVLFRQRYVGDWSSIAAGVIAYAREIDGPVVVIVDTLGDWASLPGDSENDSGAALEAMRPLQEMAGAGLAVIDARHERKSGGDVGESGRGSSAFGGAADCLLSLGRPQGGGHETRRELEVVSRFDDVPPCLVVELVDGRYILRGTESALESRETRAKLLDVLPACRDEATHLADLERRMGDSPRSTVRRALETLERQGLVLRAKGAGSARSDCDGYWLAPKDDE